MSAARDLAVRRAVEDTVTWVTSWGGDVDREDIEQDAQVLLLERPELSETPQPGLLRHRLRQDLRDKLKGRERTRTFRHGGSLDERYGEELVEGATPLLHLVQPSGDAGERYCNAEIIMLLPAVFDPDHSAQGQLASARLQDLRAASAVTPGWLVETCAVDVQVAWDRAPLTEAHRAVLEGLYGRDQTQLETARRLGLTVADVAREARAGLRVLARQLNRWNTDAA